MRVLYENAKLFYDLLNIISQLYGSAYMTFNEDGVIIKSIDPSSTAMLKLTIPKDMFNEWEVDEEEVLIDMESLVKVLRITSPKDSIEISFERDEKKEEENEEDQKTPNMIVLRLLKIDKSRGGKKIKLKLSDPSKFNPIDSSGLESLSYKNVITIDPSIIAESVRAASLFSEEIDIITRESVDGEKELVFRGEGVYGEIEDIIDPEDIVEGNIEVLGSFSYSTDYMKNIFKIARLSNSVTMSFGELENNNEDEDSESDEVPTPSILPLRLDFTLDNIGTAVYFLAPRIKEEDIYD